MSISDIDPFARAAYLQMADACRADPKFRKLFNAFDSERKALRELIGKMLAAASIKEVRGMAEAFAAIEEHPHPTDFAEECRRISAARCVEQMRQMKENEKREAERLRVEKARRELNEIRARERRIAELEAIIATADKPGEGLPISETVGDIPEVEPDQTPEERAAETARLISESSGLGSREALPVR